MPHYDVKPLPGSPDQPFHITKYNRDIDGINIFTEPWEKDSPSPYSVEEHELTFRSYDDDGYFYFEGTTTEKEYLSTSWMGSEEVPGYWVAGKYAEGHYGAVWTRVYDRRTGKRREDLEVG
jgi:hypothetical protein